VEVEVEVEVEVVVKVKVEVWFLQRAQDTKNSLPGVVPKAMMWN
jgi:hypothetical protein